MEKKRTREDIINALKQSILKKQIVIQEAKLNWYKQELKNIANA